MSGTAQSWFPPDWTPADIKHAGIYVAEVNWDKQVPDGVPVFAHYNGVRVGIIRTNGEIATIFPNSDQTPVLRKE